jgi:nitrate reductase gamma subunit
MTNNLFLRRAAVAAGAILVAAAEFAILHSAAGVDLAAHSGESTRQITVGAVVVAAAVAALAGWALLALLERRTGRARVWWTSIAVAVLLLSLLVGPLGGVGAGAKLSLALLHLSVGAVLILGLPRPRPEGANR